MLFCIYILQTHCKFHHCGINKTNSILFSSIHGHIISMKEFLTVVPARIEAARGQFYYAVDRRLGLHRTGRVCDGAVH